jgi:amino acid transporter
MSRQRDGNWSRYDAPLVRLVDWILGKALSSNDAEENKVTTWAAIPMLGLDALTSAAYGPEAALTILLPLGLTGVSYMIPIVAVIVTLLAILYFSYRQTIQAYPNGGGSYIVAHSNLGKLPGLFAASALMLDYVLTVAVGISAGVGALISAVPSLHSHTLAICLGILAVVTIVNLRGLKDAGGAFFVPTYLFILSLLGVIVFGLIRAALEGGHPVAYARPPAIPTATAMIGPWLLVKAFASGCTAMTGVEAVSNGIQAFTKPRVERAQQTLTAIVVILGLMLLGIAFLCRIYHISATDPGSANYQSVVSQLVGAIVGRGAVYYVTLFSVIAVLALSANTGFADFPRLCHLVAEDDFLPHAFTMRGRRLVYSSGILILAVICGVILVAFGGITDRLIPLYAIGAFLAFTLSQAGMVVHWGRERGKGWKLSRFVNGFGAVSTGVVLVVVLVAKFAEGAWITVLLIPTFVGVFLRVNHHYKRVKEQVGRPSPFDVSETLRPISIVPLKDCNLVSQKALRFAMTISDRVIAIHVDPDEGEEDELDPHWSDVIVKPLEAAGKRPPELVRVKSQFRRFIRPVLDEVKKIVKENPGAPVVVVVPQLVESNWLQWPLHNQRSNLLKAALLFQGGSSVIVANVPWYLDKPNTTLKG